MQWRRNVNTAVIIINDNNNRSNRKINKVREEGREGKGRAAWCHGWGIGGSSTGARLILDALVV